MSAKPELAPLREVTAAQLFPRDRRFAREAGLLSLLRHPSIPRLWDSGDWQHPLGTLHPSITMEWVDGAPLYDQVRRHPPSTQLGAGKSGALCRAQARRELFETRYV